MTQRSSSIFGFAGTLAAALVGAAVLTTDARAEGPIGEPTPFTSMRSRADVQAELMRDRQQASSFASELTSQQGQVVQQATSGYTRAEARAAYIAARDEVHAMTSEHGGSGYFAARTVRTPLTLIAGSPAR